MYIPLSPVQLVQIHTDSDLQFPRVKVFLDEYTLKVSPQCKAALNKLRDTKTIEELLTFQRRFGKIL